MLSYSKKLNERELTVYNWMQAEDMFTALKASVVEMIEEASWPDAVTKRKALSKARNLRPNLVAPSIFFNETFLEAAGAAVIESTTASCVF